MDPGAASRDRALRRVRAVSWATGIGAVGLTAALSAAAAHAFKGHDGTAAARAATVPRQPVRRVVDVPAPDDIPTPAGAPAPPQPPPAPPAAPPPAAVVPPPPPPVSSGGS